MFLALKDIRHALGRFTLLGGVVALISLLIVMLTGLTSGLGNQNTSALAALTQDLNAEHVVFSQKVSFDESQISPQQAAALGTAGVTPLGVTQTRLTPTGGEAEAVAVFGLPAGTSVPGGTVPAQGLLVPGASSSSAQVGDQTLPVVATDVTEYYSHLPVAWTSLETWEAIAHTQQPTVLLVTGDLPSDQIAAAGLVATDLHGSYQGLAAYQSERGSLLTMQVLLYAISALVVVAFLSVWTIQRTRDIAILRALGAAKTYVLRDSLGQAGLVVGAGVLLGTGVAVALGWLAGRAVPIELDIATVAGPAVGVFSLGLIGALIATRKVANTDPQLALGV